MDRLGKAVSSRYAVSKTRNPDEKLWISGETLLVNWEKNLIYIYQCETLIQEDV